MAEMLVLGAGMVGIGAALALQGRGHEVTVLDRRAPGQETSYGNAGLIQREAAEPYAIPRDVHTLWRYATGRTNDVVYRFRDAVRVALPLWRYFSASAKPRHRAIAQIYALLIASATQDHGLLIEAAGAEEIIRREGFYQLYRSVEDFERAAVEAERFYRTYGTAYRLLDGQGLMAEEPALRRRVPGAVHWTQSWSTTDPGALVAAYAHLFVSRGGRLLLGDALTLRQHGQGWEAQSRDGPVGASDVVVALGPWSGDLLGRFGYRVPMIFKRGYHRHFSVPIALNRPLMDVANAVVLSSMSAGLRIATGAALVDRAAPMNLKQLERGLAGAQELLEVGAPTDDAAWVGHRPCMPDMLPVVGLAPRHRRLWCDFGHGHQGLTLGPTTGALLADVMEGRSDDIARAVSPAGRLQGY